MVLLSLLGQFTCFELSMKRQQAERKRIISTFVQEFCRIDKRKVCLPKWIWFMEVQQFLHPWLTAWQVSVAINSTKIQMYEGVYVFPETAAINFFFFCSYMYLPTRILFLSCLMTHLLKQIRTVLWWNYFPGKVSECLYSDIMYVRTSLQNLKHRALTQATKRTRSTGSRSSQEPQLKKPESAGKTTK